MISLVKIFFRLCLLVSAAGILQLARAETCSLKDGSTRLEPAKYTVIVDTPFAEDDPDSFLYVFMDIDQELSIVPAFPDVDGGFGFVVAANYAQAWTDKSVTSLWLTDGDVGCEIENITHAALPRRPGALHSLSLTMMGPPSALAADMGYSTQDIKQSQQTGVSADKSNPVMNHIAFGMSLFQYQAKLRRDAGNDPEVSNILNVMDAYIAQSEIIDYLERGEILDAAMEAREKKETENGSGKTLQFFPLNFIPMTTSKPLNILKLGRLTSVSYTHLTLPTTPYV